MLHDLSPHQLIPLVTWQLASGLHFQPREMSSRQRHRFEPPSRRSCMDFGESRRAPANFSSTCIMPCSHNTRTHFIVNIINIITVFITMSSINIQQINVLQQSLDALKASHLMTNMTLLIKLKLTLSTLKYFLILFVH